MGEPTHNEKKKGQALMVGSLFPALVAVYSGIADGFNSIGGVTGLLVLVATSFVVGAMVWVGLNEMEQ